MPRRRGRQQTPAACRSVLSPSQTFFNKNAGTFLIEKAPLDASPICTNVQMMSDTVSDALTRYEKQNRLLFMGNQYQARKVGAFPRQLCRMAPASAGPWPEALGPADRKLSIYGVFYRKLSLSASPWPPGRRPHSRDPGAPAWPGWERRRPSRALCSSPRAWP